MSNIFIPASIKDKATRDTFIAVVKEVNNVKKITAASNNPDANTPGKTGDIIFAESTNIIWVFSGSSWVLAADNNASGNFTDLQGTIADAQIPDAIIDADKLGAGAVTSTKVFSNAITSDKIVDGAVTVGKIQSGSITGEKIADVTINGSKIVNGTLSGDKVASTTLTGDKLANAGIITSIAQLGTSVVDTTTVVANAITAGVSAVGATLTDVVRTDTSEKTLATLTLYQNQSTAQISTTVLISHLSSTGGTSPSQHTLFNLFLYSNSTLLSGVLNAKVGGLNSPSLTINTTVSNQGTNVYRFKFQNVTSALSSAATTTRLLYPAMTITELKR